MTAMQQAAHPHDKAQEKHVVANMAIACGASAQQHVLLRLRCAGPGDDGSGASKLANAKLQPQSGAEQVAARQLQEVDALLHSARCTALARSQARKCVA